MKQFFKFFFASVLGTFVTFIIVFLILMGVFVSVISFSEKEAVKVKSNSLLHIKLEEPIMDRTPASPFSDFDLFNLKIHTPPGLNDILKNIKKAKTDNHIKGIYLELSYIPAGISTIKEIRTALEDFKESGKFIICYGNYLSQTAYYLGSVADEIYLNPNGMIIFKGLTSNVMFLKGTLEKLDIEAQIFRQGKYKSAVEMFMRDDLSSANKKQLTELVNSIWDNLLIDISESRDISTYDLNIIANNLEVTDAENALKYNFVNDLKYKDELLDILRNKLNISKDNNIRTVTLSKYTHAKNKNDDKAYSRDRIAVVYAQGEIIMDNADDLEIGADRFAKALRKARTDNNVKAIVLRINSPGGGSLPAEIIRREVALAAQAKPLVVSMGDLAASGGYWIACDADKIYAEQTTLTGSIGVYAIIPNFQNFLDNKLGITFGDVKTNENSEFIPLVKPLPDYQKTIIKEKVNNDYDRFLNLVAEGRKLKVSQVDSIAQGRIWSGIDAKRIGLIDEFGGLNKAITAASEMAEITDYRIRELPEQKDPFEELFKAMFEKSKTSYLENKLGNNYKYYKYLKSLSKAKGVQARIPFYLEIQ